MLRQFREIFFVLLFLGPASCTLKTKKTINKTSPSPVRQEKAKLLPWTKVPVDERGQLKQKLVLSLDDLSKAQDYQGTLPFCHKPFKENVALGFVTCAEGNKKKVELFAANLRQECYTDTNAKKVEATKNINLTGCKLAEISLFNFQPSLQIDLER